MSLSWVVFSILKFQKAVYCFQTSKETKYQDTSSACIEVVCLRGLLKDFDIHLLSPTLLYADNLNTIRIGIYPLYHERTKHIELD